MKARQDISSEIYYSKKYEKKDRMQIEEIVSIRSFLCIKKYYESLTVIGKSRRRNQVEG